jgi:hypothetical protein
MVYSKKQLKKLLSIFALALGSSLVLMHDALAVPSFARQTGTECASCHTTGFSVLTTFGRQFKLRAYTLGERNMPFVVGGVASLTQSQNSNPAGESEFKSDNQLALQRVSAYFAGKITDNAGAFVNWNYDGIERRGTMEMVDVRYANSTTLGGKDLLLGVTLNNNPTVSDIYNSTPAFGFPQISPSDKTAVVPNAMAQVDMSLASQVAGIAAYAWWDNSIYAELGAYRTADKMFSVLRAGVPRTGGMDAAAAIKSGAPYWRLAYERQWNGAHSLSAGTFGLLVDRYPDPANPSGPTDRYRDLGFDAQYQYVGDEHRVTSGLTWIQEKQSWQASFDPSGMASMRDEASGKLTTSRAHIGYVYRKQYGASLGYFATQGNTDAMLYNTGEPITGSVNGSPDTSGGLLELSYIPQQNVRLALRYTTYSKFNGAKSDYDGFGRNASDNDNLYFSTWFLF